MSSLASPNFIVRKRAGKLADASQEGSQAAGDPTLMQIKAPAAPARHLEDMLTQADAASADNAAETGETMRNRDETGVARLLAAMPQDAASLAWHRRAQGEQLCLCDALEAIADSLPDNVNRQKCIYAAKALGPLVRGVHRYEEDVLFPALANMRRGGGLADAVDRLRFEHCEDECFAEELTEMLLRLGRGEPVNAETAGYMLRGFFEAMRRHIAFERQFILSAMP